MRALCAAVLPASISTLALGSAQAAEWAVTGRVVAITNADTLTVLDDAKRQHKVRIAEIDAPGKRQAFGDRSRQHLGELVHEKRLEARCRLVRFSRTHTDSASAG